MPAIGSLRSLSSSSDSLLEPAITRSLLSRLRSEFATQPNVVRSKNMSSSVDREAAPVAGIVGRDRPKRSDLQVRTSGGHARKGSPHEIDPLRDPPDRAVRRPLSGRGSSHRAGTVAPMSADRAENHDPIGDISRTNAKGRSTGLTRSLGIRELSR
jgi:hypothetical protein